MIFKNNVKSCFFEKWMMKKLFEKCKVVSKNCKFFACCYTLLLLSCNMLGAGWYKLVCMSSIFKTVLARLKEHCAGTEIFLVLIVLLLQVWGGGLCCLIVFTLFFLILFIWFMSQVQAVLNSVHMQGKRNLYFTSEDTDFWTGPFERSQPALEYRSQSLA